MTLSLGVMVAVDPSVAVDGIPALQPPPLLRQCL